jgi:hypothetical protein
MSEHNGNNDSSAPTQVKEEGVDPKTFWPVEELPYLYGLPINPDDDKHKNHRKYTLTVDMSTVESTDASPIHYTLYHPAWSLTMYNIACDLDITEIPLPITQFSDNSENTVKKTSINEIGSGICPVTVETYCKFFEIFDFTKPENTDLIHRIYTCESYTDYKFEPEDYLLANVAQFINYFEKNNGGDNYKNAQLMQSILILCDFMNCKILQSFAGSRLAYYINIQIEYFESMRSEPDKLKAMLSPTTDMSWIRDTDDTIVHLFSQWIGQPFVHWESYEKYQEYKNSIGWIKDQNADADWVSIESNAKSLQLDMSQLYIVNDAVRYQFRMANQAQGTTQNEESSSANAVNIDTSEDDEEEDT